MQRYVRIYLMSEDTRLDPIIADCYFTWKIVQITPASNLGYLAPPGQFFMDTKLFIGTPWMRNDGVLKKILVSAM